MPSEHLKNLMLGGWGRNESAQCGIVRQRWMAAYAGCDSSDTRCAMAQQPFTAIRIRGRGFSSVDLLG
jgi:hypothetical protein